MGVTREGIAASRAPLRLAASEDFTADVAERAEEN
jgi:hypothetical protein